MFGLLWVAPGGLLAVLVGSLKQQRCCKATKANPKGILRSGAALGSLQESVSHVWVALGRSRGVVGSVSRFS